MRRMGEESLTNIAPGETEMFVAEPNEDQLCGGMVRIEGGCFGS